MLGMVEEDLFLYGRQREENKIRLPSALINIPFFHHSIGYLTAGATPPG
jgi:hypothetical protein